MGLFSWKTSCTKESIPCVDSSRGTFTVFMIDNKGNRWKETKYQGYGVFGGKDYYQLVAEMNNLEVTGDVNTDRELGIDIVYKCNEDGDIQRNNPDGVILPILVTGMWLENYTKDDLIEIWNNSEFPETCEYQGYFYDDDEEDDDIHFW